MENQDKIDIYGKSPRYWQYKGKPVFLIGGSVEDNLFQIDGLREHLDLLKSVGGNYVRNTMSARDPGNVQPHKRMDDGKYDLDQWSEEYWARFESFLKLTCERDIIAQFEMWDRFDFAREFWQNNSFNPQNNRNYSAEESKLKESIDTHPGLNESRWFFSVPGHDNNGLLLKYQKAYVDKVLSYSLDYPNVLYCMDNETKAVAEWGAFWSEYMKGKAKEKGVLVHTTEMWDAWDLSSEEHQRTWVHPETYSFCDVSQNNQQKGQTHWDNLQAFRKNIVPLRPLNTVKTYGADGGPHGNTQDGVQRFWRSAFGGCASVRFHRPSAGQGLNELAQANIKSLRMVMDVVNPFSCDSHNELLSGRPENGSYVFGNPEKEVAVYFPNGEPVSIDLSGMVNKVGARWLQVENSQWGKQEWLVAGAVADLRPPSKEPWVAVIQ